MLANELELLLRMAQFSREVTYAGYSIFIEHCVFSPIFLNGVGSISDYFLPAFCVCVYILGGAPFQHAYVLIREHNFWARYAFLFQ